MVRGRPPTARAHGSTVRVPIAERSAHSAGGRPEPLAYYLAPERLILGISIFGEKPESGMNAMGAFGSA